MGINSAVLKVRHDVCGASMLLKLKFGPALFLLEMYLEGISIQVCTGIWMRSLLMHFLTATNEKYFKDSTVGAML